MCVLYVCTGKYCKEQIQIFGGANIVCQCNSHLFCVWLTLKLSITSCGTPLSSGHGYFFRCFANRRVFHNYPFTHILDLVHHRLGITEG